MGVGLPVDATAHVSSFFQVTPSAGGAGGVGGVGGTAGRNATIMSLMVDLIH